MSDILLQKKANIERYIKQSGITTPCRLKNLWSEDFFKQDAIVINLQRACEQCIDMANHAIRLKKLGLPADSTESFTLLKKADIIDAELEKKLTGMVGFRNVVTHQYREIDYKRVEAIIKKHADDLIKFAAILVALPK